MKAVILIHNVVAHFLISSIYEVYTLQSTQYATRVLSNRYGMFGAVARPFPTRLGCVATR